jgi:hypothetical protein
VLLKLRPPLQFLHLLHHLRLYLVPHLRPQRSWKKTRKKLLFVNAKKRLAKRVKRVPLDFANLSRKKRKPGKLRKSY